MLLSQTLKDLGFVVTTVHSGDAALTALHDADARNARFAFVLMDWHMPGMDGLQTVSAIRAEYADSAPCILMVTAHRRQELVKGARSMGVDCVLSKPVSGSMLINGMMQVIGLSPDSGAPSMDPSMTGDWEQKFGPVGGARVLLVEDNEINQQVACEMLRSAGFAVDLAENGAVAIQRVQAQLLGDTPYDIVLMDMQMPVMDGVTAALCLREFVDFQQLPIVAMTANAMKADRERCLAAGMNGFVTKPINPEELWRAMITWIRLREGLGTPAPIPEPLLFETAAVTVLAVPLDRLAYPVAQHCFIGCHAGPVPVWQTTHTLPSHVAPICGVPVRCHRSHCAGGNFRGPRVR